MDILLFSFNSVMPMMLLMLAGFFMAQRGIIGEKEITFLNTFCFNFLLPANVFHSVFSIDFQAEFNFRLIAITVLCVIAIFVIAWLVFTLIIRDIERRAIFITTSFRSNNLIVALPLAGYMFGEAGIKPAAMLVPVTVIFFNLFAVITLVYHAERNRMARDSSGTNGASLFSALKVCLAEIIKNPLILGSVCGIVLSAVRAPLPRFFSSAVGSIAAAATPVALILLGAQIDFAQIKRNPIGPLLICLVRLVIVPALVIPVMVLSGFRGTDLSALAIAFASPPAVANMVMARNYGVAPQFAAQAVYLPTVASIFTLFWLISLLRALQLV